MWGFLLKNGEESQESDNRALNQTWSPSKCGVLCDKLTLPGCAGSSQGKTWFRSKLCTVPGLNTVRDLQTGFFKQPGRPHKIYFYFYFYFSFINRNTLKYK